MRHLADGKHIPKASSQIPGNPAFSSWRDFPRYEDALTLVHAKHAVCGPALLPEVDLAERNHGSRESKHPDHYDTMGVSRFATAWTRVRGRSLL